ncbi:hypothetical protein MASR1M31_02340 [Porphyromonadaceae bacterium]
MKWLRSLIAVLMAGLLTVSGSGAYYVHFCCHSCQDKGIVGIALAGCEDVHQGDKEHSCCATHAEYPADNDVAVVHSHGDHCSVEHFAIDLDEASHGMISASAVPVHSLLTNVRSFHSENKIQFIPADNYGLLSGRDLLSLCSVLLI